MKALQIQRFGETPDGLKLVRIDLLPLRNGEVRVRTRAAGIDQPPILLDGRNALDRARLTRCGFRYLGIAG
jgi:hypothetical protein